MSEQRPITERLARDLEAVGRNRDREAFARLFAYFAPRVKAYLRRIGADPQQAEELAQEVMLTVWRRARQFDPGKSSPSTWIFTIARNKRIDMLRRRAAAAAVESGEARGEGPQEDVGEAFEAVDIGLMRDKLVQAIAELPPEQAEVLRIFYLEGKSHSEIADALGLPLGTVKSRLRLALARLREKFAEAQA